MPTPASEYTVDDYTQSEVLLGIALDILSKQAIGQRGLHASFMTMGPKGSSTLQFVHSDRKLSENRAVFRNQLIAERAFAYWATYPSKEQITLYVETTRDHAMASVKVVLDAAGKIAHLERMTCHKSPYADLLRNVLFAVPQAQ